MIVGPLAFLLFFLFMSDTARGKIGDTMAAVTQWINAYQPVSYMVVAIILMAPLLSYLLVLRWPRTPDPENPLNQYKREHPEMLE